VEFTPEQTTRLREVLAGQLATAYAASPRSEIVVTYDSPVGRQINWHVKAEWVSVEVAYDAWVATRKPPFFGTAPDARVWSLANEVADAAACPALDIGAGTGRNALALARRGHPVDAVEMSSKFAAILRDEAARESLPVRVIERDLFAGAGDLRSDYGLVVLSEVVTDFSSPTTRLTTTSSNTYRKGPGRRRAGMPTGRAASTCSTSRDTSRRSNSAGSSIDQRGENVTGA